MTILVDLIKDSVKPSPNPCVMLSGGLDSTILLHHLSEKQADSIHTYTHYWGTDEDELDQARKVAEIYNTIHHEVEIKDILATYKLIIPFTDRPHRWAFYWWFTYKRARADKRLNVYIGEGLDEHFGGYWYRPEATPQEHWSSLFEYSIPTHKHFCEAFRMTLHSPFAYLPIANTLPYFDKYTRDKNLLREYYRGVIPDFVLDRKKQPGRTPWLKIWDREVSPHIPGEKPKTRYQAQRIIWMWIMKEWVREYLS